MPSELMPRPAGRRGAAASKSLAAGRSPATVTTMAARKNPPKKRKQSKRKAPSVEGALVWCPLVPRLRISELDQSRRDALGIALAGIGALFAVLFYFGFDGGRVGHVLSEALRFFFGAVAYLTPLVLLGAAARSYGQRGRGRVTAIAARRRSARVRADAGLAAGSLGLRPGSMAGEISRPGRLHGPRRPAGEGLYSAISSLFSAAGAHLVFVFALAAGLLLTTGASAAGLIHRARAAASRAEGRACARGSSARPRRRERAAAAYYDEPDGEPEVRALHEQDPPVAQDSFAAEDEALKPTSRTRSYT